MLEQADWRDDTDDDELEDQELEVHYMYVAQLQEVFTDAADSGPIFDDEPLHKRYFSERSRLSHINVNNGKSKESFHKQTTLLEKWMDESIQLDKQCQSSLEIFKVKSINAGLAQFQRCLNEEMVADLRYFNSLELEVDSLRSQLENQKT
nr:hypothetical protein [Tanacetum cinerariifolium]